MQHTELPRNTFEAAILTACLAAIAVTATAEEPPLSPVCWPPNFAGIVLGITTDPDVERLLGKGVFVEEDGDTGGRYFIDANQTATLHSVSYTDRVVGELTLEQGVAVTEGDRKAAISKWFDPTAGFGNWHALHLGSSKAEVRKNLGAPVPRESTDNSWRFDSKCACELDVFFTVHFENDHIYKVVFSAPPS